MFGPRFPPFDSSGAVDGAPVLFRRAGVGKPNRLVAGGGMQPPVPLTTGQTLSAFARMVVIDCAAADQEFILAAAATVYPLLLAEAIMGRPATMWISNTGTVVVKLKTAGTDRFGSSTSTLAEITLAAGATAILTILPQSGGALRYQILT